MWRCFISVVQVIKPDMLTREMITGAVDNPDTAVANVGFTQTTNSTRNRLTVVVTVAREVAIGDAETRTVRDIVDNIVSVHKVRFPGNGFSGEVCKLG